jgi:PilZ domain
MDSERRRSPRYQFVADTEITEITSNKRLGARSSDLGLGGCFLDMLNPPLEGTEIQVTVHHSSDSFTARGKVIFVFPNVGMGVVFTNVEEDQLAVLRQWLTDLSGREE